MPGPTGRWRRTPSPPSRRSSSGSSSALTTGLLAGYLLARSRIVNLVLSPYLVAAQSTPVLALVPLLILWFGPGLLSKVVICALIVFFPIAISTLVGLRSVDPGLIELGRSLRASPRQILTTLELPAALPTIMGGIRIGVTLAVVGAIVGEWSGADKGLGVPDQRGTRQPVRHPADVRDPADGRARRSDRVRPDRPDRTPPRRRSRLSAGGPVLRFGWPSGQGANSRPVVWPADANGASGASPRAARPARWRRDRVSADPTATRASSSLDRSRRYSPDGRRPGPAWPRAGSILRAPRDRDDRHPAWRIP